MTRTTESVRISNLRFQILGLNSDLNSTVNQIGLIKVIIEASAPTRADLAGGTIDIWPLYLFHPGAMTVNFALSLRAHVRIETRDDDRLILESRDRGIRFETTLDRIDELACDEQLELVSKMVHFFQPETGFHLLTHSEA